MKILAHSYIHIHIHIHSYKKDEFSVEEYTIKFQVCEKTTVPKPHSVESLKILFELSSYLVMSRVYKRHRF